MINDSKEFTKKMQKIQYTIRKNREEKLNNLIKRLSLDRNLLSSRAKNSITDEMRKKKFIEIEQEQRKIYLILKECREKSKEICKNLKQKIDMPILRNYKKTIAERRGLINKTRLEEHERFIDEYLLKRKLIGQKNKSFMDSITGDSPSENLDISNA